MDQKTEDSLFKPLLPSERVQRFLKENPQVNWEQSLVYLLDNYAQQKDGKIQWLVEGGAAVRLHNPIRRLPRDVDIVSINEKMSRDFTNSVRFGAITVRDWFTLRGLEHTNEAENILLANHSVEKINGRNILIFSPALLVVSKTISTHRHISQRTEDIEDIALLQTIPREVEKLTKSLTRKYR